MFQGKSPAQAYKARMAAAKESGRKSVSGASQYELMLQQLAQNKRRLKDIKATSAKEAVKREEILPDMKPYIDGVLASGSTVQNDVLMYYMVWAFDAGEIDECLRVAEFVIPAGMAMPDSLMSRDAIDWLAESIADRTVENFDADNPAELDNAPFTAFSIVNGLDITDVPHAKLHKAMGHVLHFSEPKKAIKHYLTAFDLWNRSGTKKLAMALEKQLAEKPDQPVPTNQGQ